MEEPNQFSNPIIYLVHFKWKQEMYDRFITNEEIIENTSGNKIVNVWENSNQNINIPEVLGGEIYRKTLSEDNPVIEIINLFNGKRSAFVQQIWGGAELCSDCPQFLDTDVVFPGDGAISFFNGKKLYHINY